MFHDRKDAGQKLARSLETYKGRDDVIVLAIPKGGVEVGYEVAAHLDVDFSIIVSRKLPYPMEPEAGFGAVAEDGSLYLHERAAAWLSEVRMQGIIDEQRREIERRIRVLRSGEPLPTIEGKTVILVDDGIAMGSTMRASIALCRNQGASAIVVAVPVAGRDVAADLAGQVDEVVVLEKPPFFQAVAQVYRRWYDVSDEEVQGILKQWRREH